MNITEYWAQQAFPERELSHVDQDPETGDITAVFFLGPRMLYTQKTGQWSHKSPERLVEFEIPFEDPRGEDEDASRSL